MKKNYIAKASFTTRKSVLAAYFCIQARDKSEAKKAVIAGMGENPFCSDIMSAAQDAKKVTVKIRGPK